MKLPLSSVQNIEKLKFLIKLYAKAGQSWRFLFFWSLLVFATLLAQQYYHFGRHLSDYTYLGDDVWEYHSMGANCSQGFGLRFGQILPFEDYHFDNFPPDSKETNLEIFAKAGWRRRSDSICNSLGLGLLTGICVLTKGIMIFFVPGIVIAGWMLSLNRRKTLPTLLLGAALALAPWSIYATSTSGRFILLSTQGSVTFLDGNHEYADGYWRPGWRTRPEAIFNRVELKEAGALRKVFEVFREYPTLLPKLIFWKTRAAFAPFSAFFLSIALMGIRAIQPILFHAAPGVSTTIIICLVTFLSYYSAIIPQILTTALSAIIICGLALSKVGRKTLSELVPSGFAIVLLNYIAMTWLMFGEIRFIAPSAFLPSMVAWFTGSSLVAKAVIQSIEVSTTNAVRESS